MGKQIYYRYLNDGQDPLKEGTWSLPTDSGPGDWMPDRAIRYSLYAGTEQLLAWLNGNEIYEAEYRGDIHKPANSECCRVKSCRLIKKTKWDENAARWFACQCVEKVSPGQSITQEVLNGKADLEKLIPVVPNKVTTLGVGAGAGAFQGGPNDTKIVGYIAECIADNAPDKDAERKWQAEHLCEYLEGRGIRQ